MFASCMYPCISYACECQIYRFQELMLCSLSEILQKLPMPCTFIFHYKINSDLNLLWKWFWLLIETYSDEVRNITVRINQPVSLSADTKEEDVVEWLLSPADNSNEYFSLYYSGEKIPRKDGCRGYRFGKNHSIYIASAQPCHAGTYTVDIRDGDSRSIVLIVDG